MEQTPHMQSNRTAELAALLDRRILVLDGAMGTQIQARRLSEADFRGPAACGPDPSATFAMRATSASSSAGVARASARASL